MIFQSRIANTILKIPLSYRRPSDRLVWHHSSDGQQHRDCNSVPMDQHHVIDISPRDENAVQPSSNEPLWILIELVLSLSEVVAAIVGLFLSKNEHPGPPLRDWVIGYASGCVAFLPLLYWRYYYRNQRAERLKVFVEYYKWASDCFFAVWVVAGIVWVSGGHASAAEAPNLYRVSIVLLTFSCMGYATTIYCCLPYIISVLGFREDPTHRRGATSESINSLPTYKFKVKKAKNNDREKGVVDGGIVTTGTEERMLSGEDAVCCICLAKYANNDELKELPCSHFFEKKCIDKWLKMNATCPLCKAEVGQTIVQALTEATANLRPGTLV